MDNPTRLTPAADAPAHASASALPSQASRPGAMRGPDGYYRITPTPSAQPSTPFPPALPLTSAPARPEDRSMTPPGIPPAEMSQQAKPADAPAHNGHGGDGATFGNPATSRADGPARSGQMSNQGSGSGVPSIRLRLGGGEGAASRLELSGQGNKAAAAGPARASQIQSTTPLNSPPKYKHQAGSLGPVAPQGAQTSAQQHRRDPDYQAQSRRGAWPAASNGSSGRVNRADHGARIVSDGDVILRAGMGLAEWAASQSLVDGERTRPRQSDPTGAAGPSRAKAPRDSLPLPAPGPDVSGQPSKSSTHIRIAPRPSQATASTNATAGPSMPTPLYSVPVPMIDADGDSIMRDAAEGLVQEQRRSLRGRAARVGAAAGDGVIAASGEGGSEMSLIAGVNASGKGVKVGGSAKIGTGPGGVQRKKKKGDVDVPNQDFCSSCRGVGRFLCCDGCPRSFHFMCLEPPLRVDELPDEETWYCKKCRQDMTENVSRTATTPTPTPGPGAWPGLATPNGTLPPPHAPLKAPSALTRPIPAAFRMMIKRLDEDNPMQFRLPQDVRTYFAAVGEDGAGGYVEEVDLQKLRFDRKGYLEERDPTRLKDVRSRPVACYVCGGSSVPVRSLATDPEPLWRPIVSCDYCSLHWHLDCLSPPLVTAPNLHSGKKWMCPNHAEQVMPRRRTIRSGVETVTIDSLNVPNNGNITIVSERPQRIQLDYEEIMVNKRRYRVPERIIQLDFFDRLKGKSRVQDVPVPKGKNKRLRRSGSESSLTSLGSDSGPASAVDMQAAGFLIGLASATTKVTAPGPTGSARPASNDDRMEVDLPDVPHHAERSTTPPGEPPIEVPAQQQRKSTTAPARPAQPTSFPPVAPLRAMPNDLAVATRLSHPPALPATAVSRARSNGPPGETAPASRPVASAGVSCPAQTVRSEEAARVSQTKVVPPPAPSRVAPAQAAAVGSHPGHIASGAPAHVPYPAYVNPARPGQVNAPALPPNGTSHGPQSHTPAAPSARPRKISIMGWTPDSAPARNPDSTAAPQPHPSANQGAAMQAMLARDSSSTAATRGGANGDLGSGSVSAGAGAGEGGGGSPRIILNLGKSGNVGPSDQAPESDMRST